MTSDGKRMLGITVMMDFVLNEGIESVLDAVVGRAGATAIACNPTVSALGEKGKGSFQPPTDAGASPRLFERPLWGKTSLWIQSGPSYRPNETFYADTPYAPRQPNELTDKLGHVVEEFIDAALTRGLKVYIQTGGATPPGLRVEDVPRLPNGQLPDRMAETGSVASDAIRAYNRAYVRDLFHKYPKITGFRPDWPEYPCYKLDEAFQDFGPHVERWCSSNGFDFQAIRKEVCRLYDYLHGALTNADLQDLASAGRGVFSLVRLLRRYPGVLEWLRMKSALSVDLVRTWREAITEFGGEAKELSVNAFMPPLTLFTGFDFAGAAEYCSAASPKLYTMHWSVMVEFWGKVLLARNPGLDEKLVVRSLANLFDLDDEVTANQISDYGYPEPGEPHPVPNAPQARKIDQAVVEAGGGMAITPIVHGYGPLEDFRRRLQIVQTSAADGVWVNRYGYLGDDKLDAIGGIWR